jgi:hypothetical protein
MYQNGYQQALEDFAIPNLLTRLWHRELCAEGDRIHQRLRNNLK